MGMRRFPISVRRLYNNMRRLYGNVRRLYWYDAVILRLVLDDFSRFSKKSGFGVFLVHPPMASVLLSASVERCFVSRMRDFLNIGLWYSPHFPHTFTCPQLSS